MVILHVIKEGREPNVTGTGIRDDAGLGQMPYGAGWVCRGEQHDRRAVGGVGRHLGPETAVPRPRDQVLGEVRGDPPNRRDSYLLDVVEAPQLGVHRREGRSAELEAPRVVVQLEAPRVEPELVAVPEPSGDGGRQPPRQLRANIEEYDPRSP